MTDSTVRWLLVGTGDIVRKRVGAALAPRLSGVCGGLERAAAIAKDHGAAEVFDDLDTALRQTAANAVYVATPVHRHRREALAAIAAGKHVLIEKPLGLDGDDAQQICDAAAGAGVTAGCAYYRRCFGRFAHLAQLLDQKALGRIVMVRTCYWSWFGPDPDDPKRWRVDPSHSGGGPLADMGSHMFDLLIALFGMPRSVLASCDTLAHDYAVEDTAAVIMTLGSGAQVTAGFGWSSHTWRHEFEVIGTEGKVLWAPADTGKVTVTVGRDVQELDLPNADNVHQPLVEDFEKAVTSARPPIVPLASAVCTNRLLDAIYRSSRSHREVET
jgi:predicted dehydrogenase